MLFYIYVKRKDGTETNTARILSFTFYKETYTPYSRLTAELFSESPLPDDIIEIRLRADGANIHQGIVDSFKRIKGQNGEKYIITSRGFTALLTENQLPPGMYTDMSVNRLFDSYFALPNITHEDNSQSSYIYVKKGTPMWDGAVNLAYKLTGKYPYISKANKFMMRLPDEPKNLTFTSDEVFDYGSEINTERMVSHYHMADISGNYGTYDYTENEAVTRHIIRHRHFELDQRFLNSPDLACKFRSAVSMRGYKRKFFTYKGYKGEDLNDIVNFEEAGIIGQRIKAVKLAADQNGIFTELSVYEDSFSP